MNEKHFTGRPGRNPVPRVAGMAALLIGGTALLATAGVLLLRPGKPRAYAINMLVDLDPNKAMLAERLAGEARKKGVAVNLSSRAYGALEAIDLVDTPNPIDVALVPGGVAAREYPNVRQVAALSHETLHLLVRVELAEGGVGALKGQRVNIGPATAATRALAQDVLAFAGLHADAAGRGDYRGEDLAPDELRRRLARTQGLSRAAREQAIRELPDAIFVLSSLPSLLARDLVTIADYRIVPLPFADAYCLDRINANASGDIRIDHAMLSAIEIPAYTYGVTPPCPAAPCRTVATRLLVVAYAPTDAEAVVRLLDAIYDSPFTSLAKPVPLRDQVPQFAFHAGSERYLRRNDPVLSPEFVASLGKFAGGLGALASGCIALYGFLRLRQLRRFEAYYNEIRTIERLARGLEVDPNAPGDPVALRGYLEDRLLDLKSRALQDFAEGGLKGEGLMSGIVSLINDTRSSLARLGSMSASQLTAPAAGPAC
jgi:TRAP-type uncharacterized transport system substrate-binding protein